MTNIDPLLDDTKPIPARPGGRGRSGRRPSNKPSYTTRRLAVVGIVLVVIVSGSWFFAFRDGGDDSGDETPAATPSQGLELHAWVPYWALEHATPELELRAEAFSEISPFWFEANGVTSIEPDQHAPEEATAEFLRIARRLDVPVVPSIRDVLEAGEMAEILADDDTRRRHVDALVEFARRGKYDGIDIDYEQFAFADGPGTWEETRPNWVAFVEELSEKLHADDRTLTVSIPPVYDTERTADSGFWVYDYQAITPHVDAIRVMAYDYSTSEPGPIAPIDWVREAVEGTAEASGDPSKLVLGLPLYGYNWPTAVTGDCPSDAPDRTSVSVRSLTDLVAKRGAQPEWNDATAEYEFEYKLTVDGDGTSCVQNRQVNFVDPVGAQLRLDVAKEAGFGGVSLWAFGYEDRSVWNRITPNLAVEQPTTGTTGVGVGARTDRSSEPTD